MTSNSFITLLSNGLSVLAICLCIAVVALWFTSSHKALRKKDKFSSEDWFIVGVFFGFIGEALDGTYWLIPWTLSFLGSPETNEYMDLGVYFNVAFRQGFTIFAAYCHIRSALEFTEKKSNRANIILGVGIALGFAYSALLFFTRYSVL